MRMNPYAKTSVPIEPLFRLGLKVQTRANFHCEKDAT